MSPKIEEGLNEAARVISGLKSEAKTISAIAEKMVQAYRNKKKIVLFGNGGSAADAQHIAAEFVGRYQAERPALPAIALTANTSNLTCIGNDYGFDRIFSRQVEALVQPGDVAVGISTSGKSPNVIAGLKKAKDLGAVTIAFTGASGGELKSLADVCLCVPSQITAHIQQGHITVGHIVCGLIDEALYPQLV